MVHSLSEGGLAIFGVRCDPEFEYLMPASPEAIPFGTFNGRSIKDTWQEVSFYSGEPDLESPNLFDVGTSGALAADEKAVSVLSCLEGHCLEFLPISVEDGRRLHIVNVIRVLNCIDKEASEWTGAVLRRPAFHASRFSDLSVFKIPEWRNSTPLALTGFMSSVDSELPSLISGNGLTGVELKELWRGDLP